MGLLLHFYLLVSSSYRQAEKQFTQDRKSHTPIHIFRVSDFNFHRLSSISSITRTNGDKNSVPSFFFQLQSVRKRAQICKSRYQQVKMFHNLFF